MKVFFVCIGALILINSNGQSDISDTDPEYIRESITRSASIHGTVTLPPSSSAGRKFRGSAYRNRGSSSGSSDAPEVSNRFLKTIISAHPTSYSIENLPVSDSVQIIQQDAVFIPNVTPVTVGSTVQFINDDPFYHNVFSLTPGAKFNIGRRPTGDVYTKEVPPTKWKVSGLGPIDLFCDIHSQMNAVILSLDTPYFTRVNEDGTFSLTDLPAGTYELRIYNQEFDPVSRKITVAENEDYEVNFNLMN